MNFPGTNRPIIEGDDGVPTMGEEAEADLTQMAEYGIPMPDNEKPGTPVSVENEWVHRLMVEHAELDERGRKLHEFIGKPGFALLPERAQFLLHGQLNLMSQLFGLLGERVFRATNPEAAAKADVARKEREAEERAEFMANMAKHNGGGDAH
jgi:hypothetical protein